MNMKPSVSPLQRFTCKKRKFKIQAWEGKVKATVFGTYVVYSQTALKTGPPSTRVVHCNIQNFETITKSSEAQKEFAAA
jgi:hypothetical protein